MDINFENLSDLNRTVHAAFQDQMDKAPVPEWQKIATLIRSGSSSNLYPFFNALGGMREWVGDAIFEELASGRYQIPNRKFQKGLKGERDQIADDSDGGAGLYGSLARIVANACASHPDELVFADALANGETNLCHSGQPFFDTAHPNQNGDGGTQSNLDTGNGGAFEWYLFDTSKPLKPLIYQLREDLRLDTLTDMSSDHVFKFHELLWNAWMRDAAGYGVFWSAYKCDRTLDEAGFTTARRAFEDMHMGVKDDLTGTYRSAQNRGTLLVVPTAGRDVAAKLFGQDRLASGESNYLKDSIEIHVSRYL